MMNGFGLVVGGNGDALSSKSTDGSSSSDGSRSPRLSMPLSSCMRLQKEEASSSSMFVSSSTRQQEQDTASTAAIRRAHRFFDGLDSADAAATAGALPSARWPLFQGYYTAAREAGATKTAAAMEACSSSKPKVTKSKTPKANRTPTILDSCDWGEHLRHSPSNAHKQRTPSQPVKCPPRRPVPVEEHPTVVHPVGGTTTFAEDDDDDASLEDVQYLKQLYEMRTWDMYVRITEARKQREELKGTANNVRGIVRGVVPMVPPLDHPDHHHMLTPAETQEHRLDASSGDNDCSGHEMIFACDME